MDIGTMAVIIFQHMPGSILCNLSTKDTKCMSLPMEIRSMLLSINKRTRALSSAVSEVRLLILLASTIKRMT